jgi:hypothetical protein
VPSCPYRDVVCIGYVQVVATRTKTYWGVNNDRADVAARWEIMKRAIKLATDAYQAEGVPRDVDEKRLKIFMAPEFYFRGQRGGYTFEELFYMAEKVREVTVLYPHWLFVLGTLIVATQKTEMTGPHKFALGEKQRKGEEPATERVGRKEKEVGMILDNYAIVQKGGYAKPDGVHDHQIGKENVSQLDYNYPFWESHGYMGVVKISGVAPPKDGIDLPVNVPVPPDTHTTLSPEKMANPRERSAHGSIFVMDGITFGFEVCLDHLTGKLARAPDKGGVQIHLIPSAGMDIKDKNSSPHTIRFNVDGLRPWRNAGPQDRKNPCVLAPEQVDWWFHRTVPADATYFPYEGHIQAYKPLKIPS